MGGLEFVAVFALGLLAAAAWFRPSVEDRRVNAATKGVPPGPPSVAVGFSAPSPPE